MNHDWEDALEACLQHDNPQEQLAACAAQNPQMADELRPLLQLAAQLRSLSEDCPPSSVGMLAGRRKLLNEAARLKSAQDGSRSGAISVWSNLRALLRKSATTVVLALLLLGLALGGGTIVAAAKSLPGDALYPIKRMTEDLQLALTLDQQAKARLRDQLDARRRQEAVAVAGSQRVAEISFRGQVEAITDNCWIVSGVPLYLSEETEVGDGVTQGAAVRVYARSLSDGRLWVMRILLDSSQPAQTLPVKTATATSTTTLEPTLGKPTATLRPASPPLQPVSTALPPKPPTSSPTAIPTATRMPTSTSTATPIPATPVPTREIKLRFKGEIEAKADDAWTVAGQVVHVNHDTRIDATVAAPEVGALVAVVAVRHENGSLWAIEIVIEGPAQTPEQAFEFQGLVESWGPTQWVVSGHVLNIQDGTVIDGVPEQGALAEVKALRRSDGSLWAQYITVTASSEEVQFEGLIVSLGADQWLVDETVVRVDALTVVSGTPAVGCRVEVQGLLMPDGAVLARKIRVVPPPTATYTLTPQPAQDVPEAAMPTVIHPATSSAVQSDPQTSVRSPDGDNIEFQGLIQAVEERYWSVCNRVVLITAETYIKGRPQTGSLAEVKGIRMFGDMVLARSIVVSTPGAFDRVEFEGTLESLSDGLWLIGGVTVSVNAVTTVQGTPALGLACEVRGVLQPDASVLAERIVIRGASSAPQIDVSGLVERIDTTQWTVAGTALAIDDQTFIDDSRAPAEVGMWAQVRALRRQDKSLLAVRVRLSRPN